jgi:CubicO group peptidase (beta-lactamase class C family)
MTKLATAVAVMQLVERGIVSLEDDVREIIPELRDIEVFIDGNGTKMSIARCDFICYRYLIL